MSALFLARVDWELVQEKLIVALVLIAVVAALTVPIWLTVTGAYKQFGLSALKRCFEGLETRDSPEPGDVWIRYHTYRGFLFWRVQAEHSVHAPPNDAEVLLGRLLRFNLTWGMLPVEGLIFIPFLALGNYAAQRASIRKQVDALASRSSTE